MNDKQLAIDYSMTFDALCTMTASDDASLHAAQRRVHRLVSQCDERQRALLVGVIACDLKSHIAMRHAKSILACANVLGELSLQIVATSDLQPFLDMLNDEARSRAARTGVPLIDSQVIADEACAPRPMDLPSP